MSVLSLHSAALAQLMGGGMEGRVGRRMSAVRGADVPEPIAFDRPAHRQHVVCWCTEKIVCMQLVLSVLSTFS